MILAQKEIRAELAKKAIKFDPPIEEHQWGPASINLRLGTRFTTFREAPNVTFSISQGISGLQETALWNEEQFQLHDALGKKRTLVLEPKEFVLGVTHEHVWIPRHLIGMVEGRSSYARAGISIHQTAPWLQPGWDGQITLEIRNNGKYKISLCPLEDMPCQITFHKLTSTVPPKDAYGSKPTDAFQNQTSPMAKKKKA